MVLKRFFTVLLLVLVIAACGKNDGFYPYGYQQPVYQAPMPTYPNGYGAPQGYPTFNPQMPGGYPQSYTPFLPIDYFMRQNPSLNGYWPGFWNQWLGYCNQYGISPYDFHQFWFDYCPQQWTDPGMIELWVYLDQNFFYWVQPYATQMPTQMDPSYFWTNYQGYGYGGCWNYGY